MEGLIIHLKGKNRQARKSQSNLKLNTLAWTAALGQDYYQDKN